MKKIFKPSVALMLALVLVFAIAAVPSAYATQAEIDSLKTQQGDLKSQENQVQSTIDALKSQQAGYIELKTALDQKSALTMQQISNLNEQIDLNQQLIEEKTVEVEEAQKVADEQLEKYKKRVRVMEENGRYNYLEVLFGASSVAEFLSLMDDIGDIMRSDKELEDAYRQAVEELKAVKKEYEDAQAEMKTKKADLVVLNDSLEQQISEAAAVVASYQADINANAEILNQINAADAALQARIDAKVQELNAAAAAASSGGTTTVSGGGQGTGSLVWPTDSTYITSVQGPRTHPVTGEYKNHGGTDIGASYGSSIYAADSGTVVTVAYDANGYGNYVMIDHGNGMQTLYGHMSSVAVSQGQSVSKGQVIGYVGSTGLSTGAHLHYEVRQNGQRTNPENYYSQSFTHSPNA